MLKPCTPDVLGSIAKAEVHILSDLDTLYTTRMATIVARVIDWIMCKPVKIYHTGAEPAHPSPVDRLFMSYPRVSTARTHGA